jgi:hypothetical protein
MNIATILGYILSNPFTSSAGLGLLLSNLGPVMTLLGNGTPIMTVVQDQHFSALLAAIAAFAAKDANVTGGTKHQ